MNLLEKWHNSISVIKVSEIWDFSTLQTMLLWLQYEAGDGLIKRRLTL